MGIKKRIVIALSLATVGIYFMDLDFTLPIQTRDCSENPTHTCLHSAITEFDYKAHLPADKYYYIGGQLINAGRFDKGIELIAESGKSIAEHKLYQSVALKIAEEALSNPDEIASFKPMEALKDPTTKLGAFIAKKHTDNTIPRAKNGDIENWVYMKVVHALIGADSGAGFSDYVSYNEKMALEKFRPNKTWDYVISKWLDSGNLIIIANTLIRVEEKEEAYKILQSITPTERNYSQYIKALQSIGKYDEAQNASIELLSQHQNLIAKSQKQADHGNQDEAISLLHQAAKLLMPDTSKDAPDTDDWRVLRRISSLLYGLGDKEGALKWAEESHALQLRTPISKSFVNEHALAKHYRLIEQPEKAKEALAIIADENPCSPFSHLEGVAEEYYHLGDIEMAHNKISQMCGSVTVFGSMFGFKSAKIDTDKQIFNFWKRVYADAVTANKDTSKIVEFAGHEVVEASQQLIAMHYLNNGDEEKGTQSLSKAIDSDTGYSCTNAFLANSADREDLIKKHFEQSIIKISKNKRGLERQTSYLQLAACHNLIRIDRLRHK